MRVFIRNFTHIEEGVKCRGKKFTYPKCLKVRFPNPHLNVRKFKKSNYIFTFTQNVKCSRMI